MTKSRILATIIIGFISSWSSSQAIADTSNPANSSKSANPSQTNTSWASFPKKVVGVATGMLVGVPVCLIRRPIAQEKYGIEQMNADKSKPRKFIPAAIFWAPFAVTAGILESPFVAVTNSLANYDKPFSKKQMSLVDTMVIEPESKPYSAQH